MVPFRLPRLPDRQAILHFVSVLQPRGGRMIGALSGMILAGPAWLYGLCVGFLLGYMVDTVRTKVASGPTEAGSGSSETGNSSTGAGADPGVPLPDEDTEAGTNAYHHLGLLPGASMAEVKKAWRIRSRQAHPDAPGGAAEDFMILKKAYEKIMEQKKTDPAGE